MHIEPQQVLVNFLAILMALTFHEFAHAWVANFMGDPTPNAHNRLNLNPMTMIRNYPLGALIFPLIGAFNGFLFGYAATPVNPHMVDRKYSYRQAERWISAAGPLSNLLFGIVSALTLALLIRYGGSHLKEGGEFAKNLEPLVMLCSALVQANLVLFLFNLIPIPPLDGFILAKNSAPRSSSGIFEQLEQAGMLPILLVFMFGGRLISPLLSTLNQLIYGLAAQLTLLLP